MCKQLVSVKTTINQLQEMLCFPYLFLENTPWHWCFPIRLGGAALPSHRRIQLHPPSLVCRGNQGLHLCQTPQARRDEVNLESLIGWVYYLREETLCIRDVAPA